jgi:hypothetical protein
MGMKLTPRTLLMLVLVAACFAAAAPAAAAKGAPAPSLTHWLAGQIGPLRPAGARSAAADAASRPLQLVRSYQIPSDDPSAVRLANWSWTYDSAATATAFTVSGDGADARRLLDQLAALQAADGSIPTAFDVRTGASSGSVRSDTVAWVGLAAAAYDHHFESRRYAGMAQRAANDLLSLQTGDGLVRGGPDVTWISTQNNLLAYALLTRLGRDLRPSHPAAASRDARAANAIAAGIDSELIVKTGGTHFQEGVADPVLALDVQSLGAMYLRSRHEARLARRVLAFANRTFGVSGRSIVRSSAPATFNETYSAPGPFSGYRPYAGAGAPNVLWFEGTAQMRAAEAAVGISTSALDASMRRWRHVTAADHGAPLEADRTVVPAAAFAEYHVWPAAAAAAWAVLAARGPGLFAAPLGGGVAAG